MEVMATLQSCLPSQARNDVAAKLQAEAYRQVLGGYTLAALKHMEMQALKSSEWFPTIAECKRILDAYTGHNVLPSKRASVRRRVMDEHQARFDETMDRLAAGVASQAEIDAMPEQWRCVGETRSYLWRLADGSYIARVRRGAAA